MLQGRFTAKRWGADGTKRGAVVEVRRGLLRALRNTRIVVIYQAGDLSVLWAQNLPEEWSHGNDILGQVDSDFLPGAMVERVMELKRGVLASGQSEKIEFYEGGEHGDRWFDMWIDADTVENDEIVGLVTTMVEVTDRKHREQTLRTLLREVSHRSKNLLAIIQSIATQTGRNATTIDGFLGRFRGRLHSLSTSQDLVTSSNWRGAMLSDLIEEQVGRFREQNDDSVRFEGVDVYLNPNAALHIGLALHELVVNSMSHGALAQPGSHVLLASAFSPDMTDQEAPSLILTWSEPASAGELPERKDFASVALERVVPASLNGQAHFNISADRFDYRLEIPAANFEN